MLFLLVFFFGFLVEREPENLLSIGATIFPYVLVMLFMIIQFEMKSLFFVFVKQRLDLYNIIKY